MKEWIKQLFCKHEYKCQQKIELFSALNGYEVYCRCPKCGKIKSRQWVKYE